MEPYAQPSPDTRCAEHTDRPATAYCSVCYRPMCSDCRDFTAPEPCCRRCSVDEILTEVRQEWEARKEKRQHHAVTTGTTESQAAFWRRFGLVAVAIISLMLMVTTFPAAALRGRQVYAINLPAEGGPSLNGCLREMWTIRGALEAHLARHGAVPHSLSEVITGPRPVCPASRSEYVYKRQDAVNYLLYCPNPQRHGVGGIRVVSGSAPVIVDTPTR
jgi:hypothetical protein